MTFSYETKKFNHGIRYIIGCDEVGRGCLAGPVVAAAVAVGDECNVKRLKILKLETVRDSKLLSPKKREELAEIIKQNFRWAIGIVSHEIIDEINIHRASLEAMRQGVHQILAALISPVKNIRRQKKAENFFNPAGVKVASDSLSGVPLGTSPFHVVIDGKFAIPALNVSQEAVVDGDAKIFTVAAASIVAKVYRDQLMRELAQQYPNYGLEIHKGYATLHHRDAILKNGLSPIHRKSFCGQYV